MKKTKKRTIGKNQYIKKKLRDTSAWRQFRIIVDDYYNNTDPITNKKLLKGHNIHHCDMRVDNYDKLDVTRFRPLNKTSHDLVHTLYRYYEKDPDILNRLKKLLDDMIVMNKD